MQKVTLLMNEVDLVIQSLPETPKRDRKDPTNILAIMQGDPKPFQDDLSPKAPVHPVIVERLKLTALLMSHRKTSKNYGAALAIDVDCPVLLETSVA